MLFRSWPGLFDPDHRVGCQPVVGVNDVEMAVAIFFLKKMPGKRTAHLLDFIDEIAVEVERAKMVPDAVNLPDTSRPITWSCEDVDLMTLALESGRQFRHMRRYASDRHRMERFPREHGYAHSDSRLQRLSLLGQCQGSKIWLGVPNDISLRLVCDSSRSRFESNCFRLYRRQGQFDANLSPIRGWLRAFEACPSPKSI